MDANTNLRTSPFKNRINREGLKDYLSNNPIHQNINSFERGSEIIDGIFCSSNIKVTTCSYQSFQQSPGDHRGIEMEICLSSVFGNKKPHITPRPPRRLQCKLAYSVKKYNSILVRFIRNHKMNVRAQKLKDAAQFPLTLPQQKQFENLDSLMVEGMKLAEKKCRKLKMGGVQWTPQVSKNFKTIHVLCMLTKKK